MQGDGCLIGSEVVYDNLDAAWVYDAGWEARPNGNALLETFHSSQSVPNIFAFASSSALDSGFWEVSVTWVPSGTRSPAAIHNVKHIDASGLPATTKVLVDQKQAPPPEYFSLGTFALVQGNGSLGLQVESDAQGWKTIVDAVKFTCRGNLPETFSTPATTPPPAPETTTTQAAPTGSAGPNACSPGEQVIFDNSDEAWTVDAGWEVRSRSDTYNITFYSSQGVPDIRASLSTANLKDGQWRMSVFWSASPTRSVDATHIVHSLDGTGAVVSTTVSVNQREEPPADFLPLGTFVFAQGMPALGLEVVSDPIGYKTIIDAVKFECVGFAPEFSTTVEPPTQADEVTTVPVTQASGSCQAGQVFIIDNLDDAVRFDDGWDLRAGKGSAVGNSFHMTSDAGLQAFVSSASLPSGRYDVRVHWVASTSRTPTAIHQVQHVNQFGEPNTTEM